MTELIKAKKRYVDILRRLVVHIQEVNKTNKEIQPLIEKYEKEVLFLGKNNHEVMDLERILRREYRKLKSWGM